MNNITVTKLGKHIDFLSGFAFKSKLFTQNFEDIPLVKGSNVHQGYIDWVGAVRWPVSEHPVKEKYWLEENDVVLAMDRPWIESGLKFSWIKPGDPKSLLVQRVCRMRGVDGLSTRYLRYLIGSPQFTSYIKPIVTGVNVPHISGQQIKDFEFILPPESTQKKVADILEGYDDLIENNNRRIAILEDMAQSLYREWFINFRYPGHKENLDADGNPKLIDSPLGQTPEGWGVKEFAESFDFWNGKKCAKSETGEFELYGANGIVGKAEEWKYQNAVIIGRVGAYCGAVEYCFDKFWGSDNTIIAKCKSEKNISYLFLLLEHFNLNKYAGGSAQPLLTQTTLKQLKYIAPPEELVEQFEEIAHKFFEGVVNLKKRNQNLKQQRDMLLPKLISGQIELKD
ncbi:hypothetical protein HG263_19000 [Pseudoalteromonas sp. JBTF-M23]|uniref:Type I restriction modification DNA specificity domain-containing protein n=1 Tax=Pseudoalteromonas caenipelagi TaxID=2726988 RepID=A0A849VH48_9GAMM|nr:restriction endonuclease subunit S [Pseudoalteromonas caenipelagi]NOU52595.1 hypothetical protein [Pseudoalteromonas caenipelagi]